MAATSGTSTLRERIAALQQRGASPQPPSPPRSQTPTNGARAGGPGLRDKIARFEQKGGTPIPRGSFGLGGPPPQQTTKRNNELWGNRIPSVGRISPTPVSTTSPANRSVSLSVRSPNNNRTRRVSMADAQLEEGSRKLLLRHDDDDGDDDHLRTTATEREHRRAASEKDGAADRSDMINSLDIASHVLTSRRAVSSPTSPIVIIREEENEEAAAVEGTESATVVLEDKSSEIVAQVEEPDVKDPGGAEDPREIVSTISLAPATERSLSPPEVRVNDTPPDQEFSEPRPSFPSGQVSAVPDPQISKHGGSLSAENSSVDNPSDHVAAVADSTAVAHESSQALSDVIKDGPNTAGDTSSLVSIPLQETDVLKSESVSQDVSQKIPVTEGTPLPLEAPIPPAPPPVDNTPPIVIKSTTLHDLNTSLETEPATPPTDNASRIVTKLTMVPEEISTSRELNTSSETKPATPSSHGTESLNDVASKLSPHSESLAPISPIFFQPTPEITLPSKPPLNVPASSDLTAALQLPDGSLEQQTDTRPSPVGSSSVSDDSPHVTPILDAFPAVPRSLPPTSLPTRARTISGHPRSFVDRRSASSTSSTKSTPSLSFSSSTSSSTSSPTSTLIPTAQPVQSKPLAAPGLQRSKSQTTRPRPISSVPAWWDDDSDDGEAGWASVVVTTRRY